VSSAPARRGAVDADLEAALARRLRRSPGELLRERSATVQLSAGDAGGWSVELRRGRPITWRRGSTRHPTTTVLADLDVLTALVDGRLSGVRAFLDGEVTVRGDVGLALALDGVFRHEERHETWPRTRQVNPVVAGRVMPTATIGAGEYDDPPVVLLHGLGATAASLLPLQWDLARDHRVHAPDMPGFGDSAKPRGAYDPAFFVRWLTAYLDVLGIDECVLVGNSLGGRVALEAGLAIPERVRALVLLCPSPAFRRVRQLVPLVRLIPNELARLPVFIPHAAVVEGVRSMMSVPERLPQSWYDAGADEFLWVWRSPAARRAFVASMRQIYLEHAYGERGFWDRLPSLSVPALFVWGDRDRLVPSSFARHVVAAVPASASIVLEDCGHVPQMELPEQTAAVVRAFLAGHDLDGDLVEAPAPTI